MEKGGHWSFPQKNEHVYFRTFIGLRLREDYPVAFFVSLLRVNVIITHRGKNEKGAYLPKGSRHKKTDNPCRDYQFGKFLH